MTQYALVRICTKSQDITVYRHYYITVHGTMTMLRPGCEFQCRDAAVYCKNMAFYCQNMAVYR